MKLDLPSIKRFRRKVRTYYRKHKRPMPWRDIDDAYKVLVSEIMLQQTQVPRVLVKYPEFIDVFPDLETLAFSPLDKVLAVWQGLGYNRRAMLLKKMAETVVNDYEGVIPGNIDQLRALPGIGPYTAAAVRVFAFNQPEVLIETNVRSVFIHEFFADTYDIHDREIMPLISQTLPQRDPRSWYYALMDYGTHLKSSRPNPNRRSKHYTRQSRFEGSDRQVRGNVLKSLLANGRMTKTRLQRLVGEEGKDRFSGIVNKMEQEGLIISEGHSYYISE